MASLRQHLYLLFFIIGFHVSVSQNCASYIENMYMCCNTLSSPVELMGNKSNTMSAVEEKKQQNENDVKNKLTTRKLGTLDICPLVNGLWQIANGSLNKKVSKEQLVNAMMNYSNSGLNTWDGADIYGQSETIMGIHKEKNKQNKNYYFTKYVPFLQQSDKVTFEMTSAAINKSLKAMKTESIDLIQFHWWDYNDRRFTDICKHLVKLQKEGKISNIGLTNFNTDNMKYIIDQVKDIKIVSNQIPYSIIDRRCENKMVKYCMDNDIKLITYGTLLGGFLSNKYLGKKKPNKSDLNTASLKKYIKWIDGWSNNDWNLFQLLLQTLNKIGQKYNATIAQIAIKYMLDKEVIGAILIGCRLTVSDHIDETIKIFDIKLTDQDRKDIEDVVKKGRKLNGEPADEYRGTAL